MCIRDSDDPLKLRSYAGSRWAGAPGLLLAQRLRQQIGVVGSGGQTATNCLLRLDLQEFSQVFDTPLQSRGLQRRVEDLRELLQVKAQQAIRRRLAAAPDDPDPVSYTHLDVYKRQLRQGTENHPLGHLETRHVLTTEIDHFLLGRCCAITQFEEGTGHFAPGGIRGRHDGRGDHRRVLVEQMCIRDRSSPVIRRCLISRW